MASYDVTIIGREARVHGRITGAASLEIHGFVEGDIELDGDVTVGETGLVAADASGRNVVVRGAVKGDVTAEESVHVEEGAKVVGDVKAPRVAIAVGAFVRGHVQTSVAAQASRPRAVAAAHGAPTNVTKSAPKPVAVPAARPALIAGGANHHANHTSSHASQGQAKKAPPPPVVPILKKGAKGAIAKKR